MKHLSLVILTLCCSCVCSLAQPVISNIYLFEMQQQNDTDFRFTKPKFLTYFNRGGYNNQPAFFSDRELYISVQQPGMTSPDLYVLDLEQKTKALVTQTPEGEYSPELSPNPYTFTALRVENDAQNSQRIWEFPVDRLSNGRPLFKYITNIGYYRWLNSTKVAVFMIDNPNYLALVDVRTDKVTRLTSNVGRCLQVVPGGNLAFVHKATERTWYIKELKVFSPQLESDIVVTTMPGSEDFVVLPNGTYIMGSGSKLFKYNPLKDKDKGWSEIGDFRYYGIRNITRLALSPGGKIAIVSEDRVSGQF